VVWLSGRDEMIPEQDLGVPATSRRTTRHMPYAKMRELLLNWVNVDIEREHLPLLNQRVASAIEPSVEQLVHQLKQTAKCPC